ncbi:hypothetical protein PG2022B_0094 [Bifidobacterium animalis subsp. animalis]|nr:hypothetical protein PG2022B_0094 [Bifidobacterium animalis subsp. animalis]
MHDNGNQMNHTRQHESDRGTNALLIVLITLVGILLLAVIIVGTLIILRPHTTSTASQSPQAGQSQKTDKQPDKAQQIIEKAESRCGVLADHRGTISVAYFPALDNDKKAQGECLVNMMPESAYKQFQDDRQKAMRDCGTTYQGSETIDGIQYSWFSACSTSALDVGSNIEYKMADTAANSSYRDSTNSPREDIDKGGSTGLISDIEERCGASVIEGNHVKVSWDQVHEGIEQGEIMVCVIDFFTDDVRLPYKADHERAAQYYQENKKPVTGYKVYNGYKYSWEIWKSDDSDNPAIKRTAIEIEKI